MKRSPSSGVVLALILAAVVPGIHFSTQADLFVSSQAGTQANHVLRYDGTTGASLGVFDSGGGLEGPLGITFGPDGNLYVASANNNRVVRYDGVSGANLGTFASGGGLAAPISLTFGPDGNLYVSSSCCQVLRFNGATGAFVDVFATLAGPDYPRGLTFGPDGQLYVVSYNTASVERFDGVTGAFFDTFVPPASGGLATPSDLAFGPDGNLYVTGGSFPNPGVFRYHGVTGAFLGQFASVGEGPYPIGMTFGPDANLYVVVQGTKDGVTRFDWKTGALIDDFVASGSGGLGGPFGLAFSPGQPVEITCPDPVSVECGSPVELTAGVKDPEGRPVTVVWTLNGSVVATNSVPASNSAAPVSVSLSMELPMGTNIVGVVASSSSTNAAYCSTLVTVVDTTPPHISRVRANPEVLWPPNHRWVPVTIHVRASDACGPVTCKIKSVRSNESWTTRHGRDRSRDWIITGDLSLKLRAERSGSRKGRIYTITVECRDESGNVSTREVTVTVPHDRGRGHDDGPGHGRGGGKDR